MTIGEQLAEAIELIWRVWKSDVDGTDLTLLDDIDAFLERYPVEDLPNHELVAYVTTVNGAWLKESV